MGMTTTQANALRKQINLLAAEMAATAATETKAAQRCRYLRILELERQLTEG